MRLIDADNISNVGEFVNLDKNGNAYVLLDDLCTILIFSRQLMILMVS